MPTIPERIGHSFDRYLACVAVAVHARRRRMKSLLFATGLTSVALLVEAALILQGVSTSPRPSAISEWWPQLTAVALALMAFASLRTAVQAHQKYVDAQLQLKAEKNVVEVQVAQMQRDIGEVKTEIQAHRREFSDFLRRGA